MNGNEIKPYFYFEQGSHTLRAMPANHLVARWGGVYWAMVPDLDAPVPMVVAATKALMIHDNKYGTGENLMIVLAHWEDQQ